MTKNSDPDDVEYFDALCKDAAEEMRDYAIVLKGKANLKTE